MNYGETLAYWYLRLNGFFPLHNFVLHKYDEDENDADCDVLALRLPNVYEEIGGTPTDWDNDRFAKWHLNLARDTIGLIVQVKTGISGNPGNAFERDRIIYGVQRLGFFKCPPAPGEERQRFNAVINRLMETPEWRDQERVVAKLLISEAPPPRDEPFYHHLPLRDTVNFIEQRIRDHPDKSPAKLFFPSDLLQYIIWRCGRDPAVRAGEG